MSFFKVKVCAVGEHGSSTHRGKRKVVKHWSRWLVEAVDRDDAMEIAQVLAQNSAPIGPRWKEFQWREAVDVLLPMSLDNL